VLDAAAAQIRIETGTSGGGQLTLNYLGSGDLFGEIAALDGQPRTADATAEEPTELFVIRRDDFLGFLEREPRIAVKFITLLCQRIRYISDRMEEASCCRLRFVWRGACARWRPISDPLSIFPRSNWGAMWALRAKP
jgi:signal-transduction protein with cAMP-binding, CBS, and nucleotidyltransferase domain